MGRLMRRWGFCVVILGVLVLLGLVVMNIEEENDILAQDCTLIGTTDVKRVHRHRVYRCPAEWEL